MQDYPTHRQPKPKSLFISVGDPSGDEYASILVKELKQLKPHLEIVGLGGPLMAKAGVKLLKECTHKSSIGFLGPLKHIPSYLDDLQKAKKYFKNNRDCLVLAIDHQGFNIKLLETAKKIGLKTAYYICPQEWQWGTKEKGLKLVKTIDLFFCIFPAAADFYKKLGGNVHFVGHPIFDTLPELESNSEKKSILFLPGSRSQEITQLGPLLAESAQLIHQKFPERELKVSVQNPKYQAKLAQYFVGIPATFFDQLNPDILKDAQACLACSGTVTLKLALLGIPMVVVYKFHPISYLIAKIILGKKLKRIPYFALPNMLAKTAIIPELLQEKAQAEDCVDLLSKEIDKANQTSQLSQNKIVLEELLSPKNSCKNTAQLIAKEL